MEQAILFHQRLANSKLIYFYYQKLLDLYSQLFLSLVLYLIIFLISKLFLVYIIKLHICVYLDIFKTREDEIHNKESRYSYKNLLSKKFAFHLNYSCFFLFIVKIVFWRNIKWIFLNKVSTELNINNW